MKSDHPTPMMRQFLSFKEKHPDKILFFRMGDFYEMFGDDALEAAPILGITLTSRSGDKENSIPLCGLPHHALEKYLPRLIAAGKKVVICEQVEDPKKAKGIVKRDIVEIITPGTVTSEIGLTPTQDSILAAICGTSKQMGLATLELSTGNFSVIEDDADVVIDRLGMLSAREVLYPQQDEKKDKNRFDPSRITNGSGFGQGATGGTLTPLEPIYFDQRIGSANLCRFFSISTLDGFGLRGMKLAVSAAGAILKYLQDNKQDRLDHITSIKVGQADQRMILDSATVRNLELFYNLSTGEEKHSFFWAVNRTGSSAGARRLRRSLAAPFIEPEKINYRLDGVTELFGNGELCDALAGLFKKIPDLERLAGRLGMARANPRTLLAIRDAVTIAHQIKRLVTDCHAPLLKSIIKNLPNLMQVSDKINQAIKDDAPLSASGGGIFKNRYSTKLDDLNDSIKDAREYIASLAQSEKQRTGISSLKVGFNKVFGYYIEVTRTHSDKVPDDYIRKQTLVNAERYITEGMKEREALIIEAEEKINRLEEELYHQFTDELTVSLPHLMSAADFLAEIDLVNGLAQLAREQRYVRPVLQNNRDMEIIQGAHPVIAQILGPGNFVANDIILKEDGTSIIILTGPNMSGKSTWLRQTGLIVILAQIGSYVPAEKAEIGIVDRVFTRVGATDSLTRGQSTFLVEMVETANILNNQTEHSLLLLDEVGRGTSTFDGLSVAWSVAESIYKHPQGTPRTLFATHYHEMTGLAGIFPNIKNFQVTVKKWGKEVVFLHQVIPGGCDDSYGIEVARLAGLPTKTIGRAREILRLLESGEFAKSELAQGVHVKLNQTSLFDQPSDMVPSELEGKIREIDIDNLTPLEAIKILSTLKNDLNHD